MLCSPKCNCGHHVTSLGHNVTSLGNHVLEAVVVSQHTVYTYHKQIKKILVHDVNTVTFISKHMHNKHAASANTCTMYKHAVSANTCTNTQHQQTHAPCTNMQYLQTHMHHQAHRKHTYNMIMILCRSQVFDTRRSWHASWTFSSSIRQHRTTAVDTCTWPSLVTQPHQDYYKCLSYIICKSNNILNISLYIFISMCAFCI